MPGTVIRSVIPWTPWPEDVVRDAEGLGDGRLLLHHLQQPVVLDHDQRVDPVAQVLDPDLGLLGPAATLEAERLRDDSDRQRLELATRARR